MNIAKTDQNSIASTLLAGQKRAITADPIRTPTRTIVETSEFCRDHGSKVSAIEVAKLELTYRRDRHIFVKNRLPPAADIRAGQRN